MDNNEQRNYEPENSFSSAAPMMTFKNTMVALSSIAIAYGAYKIIGSFFDSNPAAPFSDTTHLGQWKNLGEHRKLIHAVQSCYLDSSPLFRHPAEEVIRTWDIISTSLVDSRYVTTAKTSVDRYTGLGDSVGLILEVPPQNILGTHPHDVSFPNHAKKWNLVDYFLTGTSKNDENPLEYPHYNRILTPDDLLSKRKKGLLSYIFPADYNEVLVAAKEHIRTYEGYPATSLLKVKGIVLIPEDSMGAATDEELEIAKQLKNVNPALPVYGIKDKKFVII